MGGSESKVLAQHNLEKLFSGDIGESNDQFWDSVLLVEFTAEELLDIINSDSVRRFASEKRELCRICIDKIIDRLESFVAMDDFAPTASSALRGILRISSRIISHLLEDDAFSLEFFWLESSKAPLSASYIQNVRRRTNLYETRAYRLMYLFIRILFLPRFSIDSATPFPTYLPFELLIPELMWGPGLGISATGYTSIKRYTISSKDLTKNRFDAMQAIASLVSSTLYLNISDIHPPPELLLNSSQNQITTKSAISSTNDNIKSNEPSLPYPHCHISSPRDSPARFLHLLTSHTVPLSACLLANLLAASCLLHSPSDSILWSSVDSPEERHAALATHLLTVALDFRLPGCYLPSLSLDFEGEIGEEDHQHITTMHEDHASLLLRELDVALPPLTCPPAVGRFLNRWVASIFALGCANSPPSAPSPLRPSPHVELDNLIHGTTLIFEALGSRLNKASFNASVATVWGGGLSGVLLEQFIFLFFCILYNAPNFTKRMGSAAAPLSGIGGAATGGMFPSDFLMKQACVSQLGHPSVAAIGLAAMQSQLTSNQHHATTSIPPLSDNACSRLFSTLLLILIDANHIPITPSGPLSANSQAPPANTRDASWRLATLHGLSLCLLILTAERGVSVNLCLPAAAARGGATATSKPSLMQETGVSFAPWGGVNNPLKHPTLLALRLIPSSDLPAVTIFDVLIATVHVLCIKSTIANVRTANSSGPDLTLVDVLLTILNNSAAYARTITSESSNKLLQLLSRFSRPAWLLGPISSLAEISLKMNELEEPEFMVKYLQAHETMALEVASRFTPLVHIFDVFTRLIQYQYSGAVPLSYGLLRQKKQVSSLINLLNRLSAIPPSQNPVTSAALILTEDSSNKNDINLDGMNEREENAIHWICSNQNLHQKESSSVKEDEHNAVDTRIVVLVELMIRSKSKLSISDKLPNSLLTFNQKVTSSASVKTTSTIETQSGEEKENDLINKIKLFVTNISALLPIHKTSNSSSKNHSTVGMSLWIDTLSATCRRVSTRTVEDLLDALEPRINSHNYNINNDRNNNNHVNISSANLAMTENGLNSSRNLQSSSIQSTIAMDPVNSIDNDNIIENDFSLNSLASLQKAPILVDWLAQNVWEYKQTPLDDASQLNDPNSANPSSSDDNPLSSSARLDAAPLPSLTLLSEEAVCEVLRTETLVGILPVPPPIVTLNYEANYNTISWTTMCIWGHFFLALCQQQHNPASGGASAEDGVLTLDSQKIKLINCT